MRDRQVFAHDGQIVELHDVDIERARTPMHDTLAHRLGFNSLTPPQQRKRVERRLDLNHHIEVRALIVRTADRVGLVHIGHRSDVAEALDTETKKRRSVSEIRSQRDVCQVSGMDGNLGVGTRSPHAHCGVDGINGDRRTDLDQLHVDRLDAIKGEDFVGNSHHEPFEQHVLRFLDDGDHAIGYEPVVHGVTQLVATPCVAQIDIERHVDLERLGDLTLVLQCPDDRDRANSVDLDTVDHWVSLADPATDAHTQEGQPPSSTPRPQVPAAGFDELLPRIVRPNRAKSTDRGKMRSYDKLDTRRREAAMKSGKEEPAPPTASTSGVVDLRGRTFVVTGGNGGIGLGIAEGIAQAGGSISVWGRNADKNAQAIETLTRIIAETKSAATVTAQVCDVADEDQVVEAMKRTVADHGRLDGLFANAGRNGTGTPFIDLPLSEWRTVMNVNLDGVFLTLREAAKVMVEQGTGGSLVAVSSTSAVHGAAGNEAYGTAKTALNGLVRALAVGLARHRIRVNSLLPGWTITDLASRGYADDRFRTATIKRTPVRRWADPGEFRAVGAFLADPSQTYHTGQEICVDGGYTIY
jgi:NAD(P)-dependent dehydrogenase (short-subunit alcohol dehydrogenase family)